MKKLYLYLFSALLWLAVAPVQGRKVASDDLKMLVGTYTEGSSSEGIYLLRFNQATGQWAVLTSAKAGNPSFLTFTTAPSRVYFVSEYPDGRAAAGAMTFDPAASVLGQPATAAASPYGHAAEDPCNIWTNGRFVVTANYTGGSLSTFAVRNDGKSLKLRQIVHFQKLLDDAVSHIHCVRPTPDGKYMLATDLGNDCIYRFTINPKAGTDDDRPFLMGQRIVYNGPKGWGPRHFVFSRDGQFMYLINELGGTIVVFRYIGGYLLPVQHVLAEEVPAHGSADIHLSPDGRFLYASHRLKNDGVSVYRVNPSTGLLSKAGYQTTGKHPRNFAITPNGRYLLVACRDNNTIEVYRRNKRTGLLTLTPQTISLPRPVCIVFYGEKQY
jgi:6-phosphogluconolactonase